MSLENVGGVSVSGKENRRMEGEAKGKKAFRVWSLRDMVRTLDFILKEEGSH